MPSLLTKGYLQSGGKRIKDVDLEEPDITGLMDEDDEDMVLNVMKLCSLSVIVCVVYGTILADVLEYMVQNRGLPLTETLLRKPLFHQKNKGCGDETSTHGSYVNFCLVNEGVVPAYGDEADEKALRFKPTALTLEAIPAHPAPV
jgi:hypothetical protein